MPSAINISLELSRLLVFAGRTATSIRLYSCYAKNHEEFSQQDSLELMLLAEILHYFSALDLQTCAETGNFTVLASTCRRIISQLENLQDANSPAQFSRNTNVSDVSALKERIARLANLPLAIASLKSVIEKCEA